MGSTEGLWNDQQDDKELSSGGGVPPEGSVSAYMEGWLLKSRDLFPYFFLVAMEAGSLTRAIVLLLAYPIVWMLDKCAACEAGALKLLVFIACAGLHLEEIERVGRAVLPRFFAKDMSARAWKTFSSFAASRRFLVSALPRPMLDSFAHNQLGAHQLIAPDLHVTASGHCLGFLKPRRRLASHLPQLLISTTPLHKYLGDPKFISTLKKDTDKEVVSMSDLETPVVFHDGRLVQRPTPAVALLVLLWMPVGFILGVVRVVICSRSPYRWWMATARLFGVRVIVKGKIPGASTPKTDGGSLLVSNHTSLADPIFISLALARPVTAVTYSLSKVSEVLSPIKTVRLERDAERDLKMLKSLVEKGRDVVLCPEGTTSREPVLLRFSALFAEVTDNIVPVAIRVIPSMFHGTSTRGFKSMDSFFLFMNPIVTCELIFLDKLPANMTCGVGHQSRYDVANYVQMCISAALNYKCSSLTRRDKYCFLAGTDGSVSR
eukprot:c16395_g2_i1 orf=252-1721(-)